MLPETATWLEIVIALIGIGGLGFSGWATTDDVADLARVRREGVVGGPRWLSARGNLGLNAALLCYWGGYLVVAFIAIHLPARAQDGTNWSEIASLARLWMGGAVLVGQVLQRRTRTLLRRLPASAWQAFFGEASLWRQRYHEARAEVHAQRARAHSAEGRLAPVVARNQLLVRLLERNEIDVPAALRPPEPQ